MTQEQNLRVFYNASCPVCSREIAHYRHAAERARAAVQFSDTEWCDIKALGMKPDDARRRLHPKFDKIGWELARFAEPERIQSMG